MNSLKEHSDTFGIAIIGMAGRFPGAADIRQFWANLCDGKESIRYFTTEELAAAGVPRDLYEDPAYVPVKGVLEDVDQFDAGFFGYSPREAEIIDPQQRLFLECASTALEHAGYVKPGSETSVGVFAGQTRNTYELSRAFQAVSSTSGDLDVHISNDKDFLATRVSYKLDLRGPSISIQTACSTSLVAVCEACKSLMSYECDMALAGGVSVRVPRIAGYRYQAGSIASPDGHCRPFDADGNGIVSGEGVGIVVLKRLAEALADGDTIHGVIRGWAVNNDGALKVGYTAPSVDGQAQVIATAQALAGVEPDDISYIEAHGTGTRLGDPIEMAGLSEVFGPRRTPGPTCAIGSVKSNIGHLDAAAGVAGLIKTVLALEHQEIPATLHFKKLNPKIDIETTPFHINAEHRPWLDCPLPRRAGVSSFGIGGTNAHVVLEEAPEIETSSGSREVQLLLLSARSAEVLDAATKQLSAALQEDIQRPLADVAFTLARGRERFSHRRAILCRDRDQAIAVLRENPGKGMLGARCELSSRPIAFMFPGQGAQYLRMGWELYKSERIFREEIDRCAALIEPTLGFDLKEFLYSPESDETATEQLKQTALAQPALFIVEYSLARLWLTLVGQPDAMIGHSIGEYVAACLAGVFTLEEGLQLVSARGRLMQDVPPGGMLSVSLPLEELSSILPADLSIAALNEPTACVVAGDFKSIVAFEVELSSKGVAHRRLHTSHAFHSHMMEPIQATFEEEFVDITLKPPRIPFVSNVTGSWIKASEATDPRYWARHLRETVRFGDGVSALLSEGERILLEVGPGNGLTALAARSPAANREDVFVASMRHPFDEKTDIEVLVGAAGRLWLAGADIDWRAYYRDEQRKRVPLPTYPFERESYWIAEGDLSASKIAEQAVPPERLPLNEWFSVPSWKRAPLLNADEAATGEHVDGDWLVFADGCGVADAIVANFKNRGACVVVAEVGDSFAVQGDTGFMFNPGRQEDYEAIFAVLRERAYCPTSILYLLGVTGPDPAPGEDILDCCFYGPMFLVQAIAQRDMAARTSIVFVSDHAQEVTGEECILPEKSTFLGPSRVIPQEYPNIKSRFVDIATPSSSISRIDWIAEQLICEASFGNDASVIAYRGKYRWLPSLVRVDLQPAAKPDGRLREGGTYLITGGLGGMGLSLARGIAAEVRANIVLLCRSGLPTTTQDSHSGKREVAEENDSIHVEAVRQIEASGSSVMVVAADVSDAGQMRNALDSIRQRFGEINGVIHAAGVAPCGIIQLKTRQEAERVLAPKIQGTSMLLDALGQSEADFILLCSSLATIADAPGQVDYVAANAYLDAMAQRLGQMGAARVISVKWDAWGESGMGVCNVEPISLDKQQSDRRSLGITNAEGVDVFLRVIAGRYSQIAVSTQLISPYAADSASLATRSIGEDAPDIAAEFPSETLLQTGRPRPSLSTEYLAPRDDIEKIIAGIWCELLGIAEIGVYDDFVEMGGTSLMAVQVVARLEDDLDAAVTVNEFFSNSTLESLARLVHQTSSDSTGEARRLSNYLDLVDQLSDEDVERLLDQQGDAEGGKIL